MPTPFLLPLLTISLIVASSISLSAQPSSLFAIGGADNPALLFECGIGTEDGGYLLCSEPPWWTDLPDRMAIGITHVRPDGSVRFNRIVGIGIDTAQTNYPLWNQFDSSTSFYSLVPIEIIQRRDGGFWVSSHVISIVDRGGGYSSRSGVIGFVLLSLAPNGDPEFAQSYANGFRSPLTGYRARADRDFDKSDFIGYATITAMTTDENGAVLALTNGESSFLTWFDERGRISRTRELFVQEGDSIGENIAVTSIFNDSSGSLLLFGKVQGGEDTKRSVVVRIDSTGEVVDAQTFPIDMIASIDRVLTLKDGRVMLVGFGRFPQVPLLDTILPGYKMYSARVRKYGKAGIWILDRELRHGFAQMSSLPHAESGSSSVAMMTNGEIVVTHHGRLTLDPVETFSGGVTRLDATGTIRSTSLLGSLPLIRGFNDKWARHEGIKGTDRPRFPEGEIEIRSVVAHNENGALFVGTTKDASFVAHLLPSDPFPCIDHRVGSLETTSFAFTMDEIVVRSIPYDFDTVFLSPPMATMMREDPIHLEPFCGCEHRRE